MSPEQFQQIKQKIQSSTTLSGNEKREWLFLLPKMNPEQIKELDRILSIKMPSPTKTVEKSFGGQVAKAPPRILISQKTFPNSQFHIPRHAGGQANSIFQVNDPGKLKSLTVKDLRLASSVYTFL